MISPLKRATAIGVVLISSLLFSNTFMMSILLYLERFGQVVFFPKKKKKQKTEVAGKVEERKAPGMLPLGACVIRNSLARPTNRLAI